MLFYFFFVSISLSEWLVHTAALKFKQEEQMLQMTHTEEQTGKKKVIIMQIWRLSLKQCHQKSQHYSFCQIRKLSVSTHESKKIWYVHDLLDT